MTEIRNAFAKAIKKTEGELKTELQNIVRDSWEKGYYNPERNTIEDWKKADKPNKKKTKLKND